MGSRINILCTLGPTSLNQLVIEKLADRGVNYFRINLSHTPLESLEQCIQTIQRYSKIAICIDSEGAQVRTGIMVPGIVLRDRQRVTLDAETRPGTADRIPLWPKATFQGLEPGHIIALDFDSALLLVESVDGFSAGAVVLNGGQVGSNKAVSVFPPPILPALSAKDIAAVGLSRQYGIRDFALSFANTAEDVAELRKIAGPHANIIAKIESKSGVRNLDDILDEADAILIDRGDLSREVPFENLPLLQKIIIQKANSKNRPVYVATNLLESMLVNRKPTRAELNDIMNTLLDGANGLVLAAETAIGNQPVLAVDILCTLINQFTRSLDGYRAVDLLDPIFSLLPPMHGQQSYVPEADAQRHLMFLPRLGKDLPALDVSLETTMDVEQLASGVFSPLSGFMGQAELESVLDSYRLPGGTVWTLPIIFQISETQGASIFPGMTVRLRDQASRHVTGILYVQEKYEVDLPRLCRRWFGTESPAHPGVKRILSGGSWFLGGPVECVRNPGHLISTYALSPEQTRMIFTIKGWSRVVGFHTRNVPHRAHEFVILEALRRSNADGLFIHPVIGPKKSGDFTAETILGAYDKVIGEAFPGALLGAFSTYSRYSGPREAVFTALCRKNFGCTHFVVGRDHTGVANFYPEHGAQKLFDQVGDIGITPVFFDSVHHCSACGQIVEACGHDAQFIHKISGTLVRKALNSNENIPEWFMRPSLAKWLKERHSTGLPVFIES